MSSSAQEKAIDLHARIDQADRGRARLLRLFLSSFVRNRTAVFGAATIIVFTLAALLAPLFTADPAAPGL